MTAREPRQAPTFDLTAAAPPVEELRALYLLESIKGFGPRAFTALRAAGITAATVCERPELLPLEGKRGENLRVAIRALNGEGHATATGRAETQLARAAAQGAAILTYESPAYPRNLLDSNNAVPVLYARGSLDVLTRRDSVACVGSRQLRHPYTDRHRAFAVEP